MSPTRIHRGTGRSVFCLAALAAVLLQACGREPPLVLDQARLLDEQQRRNIHVFHDYLLSDHGLDYRVVTRAGGGDLDQVAAELFESLDVGARSATGRGLLLVIDAALEQVRLEVGYALEGAYPDAFIAYVEQRQMVPFFVESRVADGILASTELIVERAQRAERNAAWDDEIWMGGSGGAGARATTRQATPFKTAPAPRHAGAGRSPMETVEAYLDAMSRRDDNPDLPIYSAASRALLNDWLVTAAQMDTVSRTYAACTVDEVKVGDRGRRAVVRYPIDQRACAPWFLVRGDSGWQLDLTMMQTAVRFGRSNAWHFAPTASHPYAFAFEDWSFDANGFPVREVGTE